MPLFDFTLTDNARAQKDVEDSKNKSVEFGITQKIFNGGKSLLEWQMQKENSFYQFLNVQKEFEMFKNNINKNYYNVLLLKLKSDLYKSNLEIVKEIIASAELEEMQGMITKLEYIESLLQFKKMELEYESALDEFQRSELDLKMLLNLDREYKIEFLETKEFENNFKNIAYKENLNEKIHELTQKAIQNSIDLKIAEAELRWAQKMNSMQKRFFLPGVSVRGGVAFTGRNYPLTSPTYSLKVILTFDDNPWIASTISRQNTFSKSKMDSISDTISGQGKINTIYFNQLRLNKIEIAQKKLGIERTKKQIADNILTIIQKINRSQENLLLNLEKLKINEQKVLLSKIQLEQGRLKKSEYLEDINEYTKEKVECFSLLKERDYLCKELDFMTSLKF